MIPTGFEGKVAPVTLHMLVYMIRDFAKGDPDCMVELMREAADEIGLNVEVEYRHDPDSPAPGDLVTWPFDHDDIGD